MEKFTKVAVQRQYGSFWMRISAYGCKDLGNGTCRVSFRRAPSAACYFMGGGLPVGIIELLIKQKLILYIDRNYGLLGENKHQAAEKLYELGCKCKTSGHFTEAKTFFERANALVSHQKYYSSVEEILNELQKPSVGVEKKEILEQHESDAERSWNQAWDSEENGEVARACELFQQAEEMYNKALGTQPDNASLKRWAEAASLKIAADKLFQQVIDAPALMKSKQLPCDQLVDNCSQVLSLYQKGHKASQDERFLSCAQIAQDCLMSLREYNSRQDLCGAFRRMEIRSLKQNQQHNLHVRMQQVQSSTCESAALPVLTRPG